MNEPTLDKHYIELLLSQKGKTLEAALLAIKKDIKDNDLPYVIEQFTVDGEIKYRCIEVGESTEHWLRRFITEHPRMLELKDTVVKLAPLLDEVLITGETGTGKEILARALHGQRTGKFVAVNCSGIPETLIESIMFGHKQGAFTGANRDKKGLMKVADNGTFFLDEIGELKLQSQGSLLRALQEKKIMKLGSDDTEDINCRIVCATNKNLLEMCKAGSFRLDLYARLSTFELDVLPLKHRECDIEPIILSLPGGPEFLKAFESSDNVIRELDLSLNVRSIQQHVKRYNILGKLPD